MRNISRNIQHILIPLLHSALRLVSSELNQTFPDKSSHMEFLEISCPITCKAARQRPSTSFEQLAGSDAPCQKPRRRIIRRALPFRQFYYAL
jgi:hypothetical protein